MPAAMVSLATITLGSAASSVTFGSIPATYRDLRLVVNYSLTSTALSYDSYIQVNNDTGSNYNIVQMSGNGSVAQSASASAMSNTPWPLDPVAPAIATIIVDFIDYNDTNKQKSWLIRANDGVYMTASIAARWASTSAINSIKLTSGDFGVKTFSTGSTFSLYGILA